MQPKNDARVTRLNEKIKFKSTEMSTNTDQIYRSFQ